jgi:putative heme iron utilization protein
LNDLTPEAFERMTAHMNDDHADSVAAYARYFGKRADVTGARIVKFDTTGITLDVDSAGERWELRIPFDHEIVDRADARATLVAMVDRIEKATRP